MRFQNISCIVITLNWSIIFIFNIDSSWLFFLLNNIKFSEALFFRLSGGLFRILIHNIPSKIKTSRRSSQFTTILKNDFVSVGGFTAFVWSKVQTEFDWRIHRKSKAIFLTGLMFFFSMNIFEAIFVEVFVWANTEIYV